MPRNGTQVSGHLDNANGLSREVIRCVDEKRKNENETAIPKSKARRHAIRVGRKIEARYSTPKEFTPKHALISALG